MSSLSRHALFEAERPVPLLLTEMTSIALFMFPIKRSTSFQPQIALQQLKWFDEIA
jgi:hypothetical protein